jgi:beta-D-xylosidase 4
LRRAQSVEAGAHGESTNLRCVSGRCPTHFPSPPNWVSSFNNSLMAGMATVFGRELRALYNLGAAKGLDCWGPVINLNRDPRWGRNGEAGSEDPYLMGQYAVACVGGFQGGRPVERGRPAAAPTATATAEPVKPFLQGVATIKHMDANSLEGTSAHSQFNRHNFDAQVDNFTLADAYFPAFREAIKEAGALGVMCSYNAVQGVPTCLSPLMVAARKQWGFQGYTTSDSDAVADAWSKHK